MFGRVRPPFPQEPKPPVINTLEEIVEPPLFEGIEIVSTSSADVAHEDKKNIEKENNEMLSEFLNNEEVRLNKEVAHRLEKILEDSPKLAEIGENAKQKAIAEAVQELELAVRAEYAEAYKVIENGYALLPNEKIAEPINEVTIE